MIDPRKRHEGGRVTTPAGPQKDPSKRQQRSKTEGTNRDFDDSGESDNQGHGHPREERGTGREGRGSDIA